MRPHARRRALALLLSASAARAACPSLSGVYADAEGRLAGIVGAVAGGALSVTAIDPELWATASGVFDSSAMSGWIDFGPAGGQPNLTFVVSGTSCSTLTFSTSEVWSALPAPPPPGCHLAPTGDRFCFGMTLALAPCNGADQAMHYWTAPSPGWILHDSLTSNEALSEWLGNNVGWQSALTLSPLDAAQPAQRWFEANRAGTDDTVIANEADVNGDMNTGFRAELLAGHEAALRLEEWERPAVLVGCGD